MSFDPHSGGQPAPIVPLSEGDNREAARQDRTAVPAPTELTDGSTPGSGAATGEGAAASPGTPAPSEWAPSREEWQEVVQTIQTLRGMLPSPEQEYEQPPLGEEDLASMDIGELLDYAVDQRIAPLLPYLESSARTSGEAVEQQTFDALEKEMGSFDRELAHHVAESIYMSTGKDPLVAVREGAAYAANIRKQEREQGISEYQQKLRKPMHPEPGIAGGGSRVEGRPKTYDEVIEKWAGETEA